MKKIQLPLKITLRAKQGINKKHIYKNDFVMSCYREIPSAANTLKIIIICSGLCTDFELTYYNHKGDVFT